MVGTASLTWMNVHRHRAQTVPLAGSRLPIQPFQCMRTHVRVSTGLRMVFVRLSTSTNTQPSAMSVELGVIFDLHRFDFACEMICIRESCRASQILVVFDVAAASELWPVNLGHTQIQSTAPLLSADSPRPRIHHGPVTIRTRPSLRSFDQIGVDVQRLVSEPHRTTRSAIVASTWAPGFRIYVAAVVGLPFLFV